MSDSIPFSLAHGKELLQRTPLVLKLLLGGLPEPWVHNHYGPDTFSPFDVVGHLIQGEKTDWMVRVRIILRDGESTPFPPFDRYAMYEADRGRSIGALLTEFDALRRRNLIELGELGLTEQQLELRGTHPALGRVTLGQLLATWVVHDLNHLHQIAKAMAFQYREEVGPWRAYLSILPRKDS